ncbi:MAG: ABC transporter permease [Armatimonadetes bacterium]|nr:ABC transporter permease [Armatimonadota bacterium]
MSATIKQKPQLIILPSRGWQPLNLRELWQFRDLLTTLAGRDLKLRYRQTALGAVWVILQPLIAAGIFSFVFGKVAKLPSDGVPYFVFSFAGLLGWNAFSGTLGKAGSSLVGNANLVSKIYFPRLVLPFATVFSTLMDFGVALTMMAVLMALSHIAPTAGLLLLPVWLFLIITLAIGISLFTSALMVSYRDVGFVVPVMTQFLLYGCPIAYPISAVPHHLRGLYYLNPLASLLEAFRWSLLGRGEMPWSALAYAAAFVGVVFVSGVFAFRKMERKFADVI